MQTDASRKLSQVNLQNPFTPFLLQIIPLLGPGQQLFTNRNVGDFDARGANSALSVLVGQRPAPLREPRQPVGRAGSGCLGRPGETLPAAAAVANASPGYAAKFHRVMEEARREQEKKAAESGGKKSETSARRLDPENGIQAQSLWDAGMAFSIAGFLASHPGTRVLHCNGSFHSAERMGVLDHLPRYRSGVSMLVVTMLSNKSFPAFDPEKMRGQGDFVIVTDPKLPRSHEAQQPAPKPAERER